MRVAAILAGVVLGLAGLLVSVIYLFVIGWSCEGTDAGDPPTPGSTAAALCDSPAIDGVELALGLTALVAPVVGGVMAARRRRPAPLLGSIATAAGAVCGLGLVLVVVGSATAELFVGLPLLACVGLGAVAVRQSRTESRQ
jgi:hypothetical protein